MSLTTWSRIRFRSAYSYAIVVNGKGPAVNGFGEEFGDDEEETSSNVVIKNNDIRDIKCWTKEIPATLIDGEVQNDARGAIFQMIDTLTGDGLALNTDEGTNKGTYRSNPVADMQLFVAQAIHDGTLTPDSDPVLQTQVNTLSPDLVEWATTGASLTPSYRCGGDSMHHVGKGVVGIRVEETRGFEIVNNNLVGIENFSLLPHGACEDYHKKTSSENSGEQQMGNVRGLSVAAFRPFETPSGNARQNKIIANTIKDVTTLNKKQYYIIGIDVQGDGEGLDINGNDIEIKPTPDNYDPEKHVPIRIRENVDSSTVRKSGNKENRNLRELEEGADAAVAGQRGGGCPFTHSRASSQSGPNPHLQDL